MGAVGVQAIATIGFVASGWFPLALLCAAVMGAAGSVHGISTQRWCRTPPTRPCAGRVLSLWGLITRACPALGALVLGGLGEVLGLRLPTMLAMLLALGVLAWGLRRLWRRHGCWRIAARRPSLPGSVTAR